MADTIVLDPGMDRAPSVNRHKLVFLHGLGADGRQSLKAVSGLEVAETHCPDLPGHGDAPPAKAGFRAFADHVRALIAHRYDSPVVLGGISMGAALSLRVALDAPELVAGLVLVRPAWINRPALPHLGIVARIGTWLAEVPDEAAGRLAADAEYAAIAKANPGAADSIRGLIFRPQAVAAADVLATMVYDRPFARLDCLEGIACPALVLANEADPLHPVGIAQMLAANLPRATYRLVPPRYLTPEAHAAALGIEIAAFIEKLGEE